MTKDRERLYLDHAATSHPKAPGVVEAVSHFLTNIGASPGRSSHQSSLDASRVIFRARQSVAKLFNAHASENVIFTKNVTEALNMVLFGWLRPGDRVVTSRGEHNALMRPLHFLEESRGIRIDYCPTGPAGEIAPNSLRACIAREPTRLVALLHGSNVTGCLRPLDELSAACGDVPLLLDAAQTAGAVPIDLRATPVRFFCFTGHKGLLGPPGTGGLILGSQTELSPFILGGTGSNSEQELQPEHLPDRLESGTPNGCGLAGLAAACDYLIQRSVENVREPELHSHALMLDRLSDIPGVRIFASSTPERALPTVSISFDSLSISEIALTLDRQHGVECRVGLHCAPAMHRHLGTAPQGTLRLSAGPLLPHCDLERALNAIENIARS